MRINSKEELLEILEKDRAVLLYFAATNCGVCEVLKPKIEDEVSKNFSQMKQLHFFLLFPPFNEECLNMSASCSLVNCCFLNLPFVLSLFFISYAIFSSFNKV